MAGGEGWGGAGPGRKSRAAHRTTGVNRKSAGQQYPHTETPRPPRERRARLTPLTMRANSPFCRDAALEPRGAPLTLAGEAGQSDSGAGPARAGAVCTAPRARSSDGSRKGTGSGPHVWDCPCRRAWTFRHRRGDSSARPSPAVAFLCGPWSFPSCFRAFAQPAFPSRIPCSRPAAVAPLWPQLKRHVRGEPCARSLLLKARPVPPAPPGVSPRPRSAGVPSASPFPPSPGLCTNTAPRCLGPQRCHMRPWLSCSRRVSPFCNAAAPTSQGPREGMWDGCTRPREGLRVRPVRAAGFTDQDSGVWEEGRPRPLPQFPLLRSHTGAAPHAGSHWPAVGSPGPLPCPVH